MNPDSTTNTSSKDPFEIIKRIILAYWPIYLISILISVLIAHNILKYAVPEYEIRAKILIKDQEKSSGKDFFEEMDMFSKQKNIDNELEIIASRLIAKQVAKQVNSYVKIELIGKVKNLIQDNDFPISLEAINEDSVSSFSKYPLKVVYEDGKIGVKIIDKVFSTRDQIIKLNGCDFYFKCDQKKLKNIEKNNYLLSVQSMDDEINNLLSKFSVGSTGRKTTIMGLSFKCENIRVGKVILNEFIKVYTTESVDEKRKIAQYTLNFIDDRLNLLSVELSEVEKSIENFKENTGLMNIGAQGEIYLQNVKSLDFEISKTNIQLSILDNIENYIKGKGTNPGSAPSLMGIQDLVLINLLNKLYDLEFELSKLNKRSGALDENYISIIDEVKNLKNSIEENIQSTRNNLKSTLRQLKEDLNKSEAKFGKLPENERILFDIGRQQNVKNEIYTYLLKKREESAISYASTVSDIRVIENAYGGTQISPKPNLIYGQWFTYGFLLPLFFFIFRIVFNPKVLIKKDITDFTNVPILSELIFDKERRKFVIGSKDRGFLSETLRSIRTKLAYFKYNSPTKVLMVTSSLPNEGKSFLTLNLGISYSLSGKKVLLIGADLRKPVLHKAFEISGSKGLSNYLAKSLTLEEIIFKTSYENVYLIPSGPVPPNPSELIEGIEFDELLTKLKLDFDVIIIDTPPLGLVTDALIIAPKTDVQIFMVRQDVTPKEAIANIIEKHTTHDNFNQPVILFNGIKPKGIWAGKKYGSSYYGYGGYGYGGYGYYGSGPKKTGYAFLLRNLFKK